MAGDSRTKLIGLLDYVEQVLRLDERVALRISEYRLADGTNFTLHQRDTRGLPGIRHDQWDEDGAIWLEIDRLTRREPPKPPENLADWIVLSSDPARPPEAKPERMLTVSSVERDAALSNGEVRPEDVMEAPRRRADPPNALPRFDLLLRLADRPQISEAISAWIVGEVRTITEEARLAHRTIGVISLIGSEQAEHIRTRLSDVIGEALMQRHAILCGDSATFQGSERDIVFLSMVADPAHKTALTMLRYEQRFNVAVSRARDRVVLVRSVRQEDLQPADLKARLIAHFENPMSGDMAPAAEGLAACESAFERDLMTRLLDGGYRVQPQVGALGFRIDLVAEGADGRRLAIECDGDRFHGPDQWHEDMRRQRVLERVGWKFWRCFASSFYRDPEGVTADLLATLKRFGIEPLAASVDSRSMYRFCEHRTVTDGAAVSSKPESVRSPRGKVSLHETAPVRGGIVIGDRVVLIFADDKRRMSVEVTFDENRPENGKLASTSPLGKAILGAEEGDEVEFHLEDGRDRKVLVEAIEKPGRRSPLAEAEQHQAVA